MTEHKRALALGDALKAMFKMLERRETPATLQATVDQLDAADGASEDAPASQPPKTAHKS